MEICNRIRARDRKLAIIMLTAKSSDEEIVAGLKLGADDYVAKPFSIPATGAAHPKPYCGAGPGG